MLLLASIAAFLLTAILAALLYQSIGRRRDRSRWPAPGRLVEIGEGTRLHLYELGRSNGPAVIFEAGLCATSLNWRHLQKTLAPFARVITYDRAGLGWSDAIDTPRNPLNLARELRALLEAAEIKPPYILVGHSFGSFVVHRFANLYPENVAGVLLLDPLTPQEWSPLSEEAEDQLAKGIRLARRGTLLARFGLIRFAVSLGMRGYRRLPAALDSAATGAGTRAFARVAAQVNKMPREVWPIIAAHWSNPQFFKTALAYLRALPANASQMASATPITGIPVVSITGSKNESLAENAARRIAPEGIHIRATRSGHWVHLDEPEVVSEVLRDMLETVRHDLAALAAFARAS